ncbi:MAG: 3-isopropylmalate dehydratase small subunit [Promethearchaeota archaeon]|nr:MAG: 3-isopropylmalate dehydratase small subunit [Candidatus Lokiarchaeota archaeon]
MKGTIIKYAEKNIDTDLIIPARYLNKSDIDHLAGHCMEDLDPEFKEKKEKLNANIMVGGANFGCGSSREQAPLSIKGAGIDCVIAPTFARIFFRNAINIGLPIIEFENIDAFSSGDEVKIDFETGQIVNLTTDQKYTIKSMPGFLQEIIQSDGLISFARKKIIES